MGGLQAQSGGAQGVSPDATVQEPGGQFVALSDDGGQSGQQSGTPVDTVLDGTDWTREDVQLVLDAASLIVLLFWAYTEVR